MSTQSILHKDLQRLSDNVDKVFICMGKKYMLHKRFGVGSTYNREDFEMLEELDRLLCEQHCALEDVRCKIEEKLNLLTLKYL